MVNDNKVSQKADSLAQTQSVDLGANVRFRLEPHEQVYPTDVSSPAVRVAGVAGLVYPGWVDQGSTRMGVLARVSRPQARQGWEN